MGRSNLDDLDLVRRVLLVLLVKDVDVPLGVAGGAVPEGQIEPQVVVFAECSNDIVVLL